MCNDKNSDKINFKFSKYIQTIMLSFIYLINDIILNKINNEYYIVGLNLKISYN